MHDTEASPFTLTLLDSDLTLPVRHFTGMEALNQPYRFDIEVTAQAPAPDLERYLQRTIFLEMGPDQGIHGVLHRATPELGDRHATRFTLALVPYLQVLEQRTARRVFYHLSVPMIVLQLLQEHEVPQHSYRLVLKTSRYLPRPFCIQHEESDLALLQRLCAEEGIHFHFEHQRDGHVLVIADDNMSFPQEPILLPFQNGAAGATTAPVIDRLFQHHRTTHSPPRQEVANRGRQNSTAGAANHVTPAPPSIEATAEQRYCDQRSRRALERMRAPALQVKGESNHRGLQSARIVQVSEHPLARFNDQWLITQSRHHAQPSAMHVEGRSALSYRNEFTALPWSSVFRPQLHPQRPTVYGFQRARVLGPEGQPATLDAQGRLHVMLWPTPLLAPSESAGLWLPFATTTRPAHTDIDALPHGGTDVLISFLDGDPDRPVVCLYALETAAPLASSNTVRSDHRSLLLDWLINR